METRANRVPPHNLEAEQSVLGGIILENDALVKSIEILNDETKFYKSAHRKIYAAILDLFEKNQPIDILTLNEQLIKNKHIKEAGGLDYLASLAETIPSASNIEYHAKIVKEKFILRQLIQTTGEIYNRCFDSADEVDELLDYAESTIFEVSQNKINQSFVGIKQIVDESFERIEKLFERKELVTGLSTGLAELDQKTAGLHPADLVIIAGRPSMGKTAFSMNVAINVAVREKKVVAVFSLEMSREQLVIRMLCSEGRINAQKVRTGYLSKSDWPDLTRAAGLLSETELYIDDTANQTVLDIRAKCRRLQSDKGLDLVIIDYLQLMSGRSNSESRQQEVSGITRSLKGLAKELKIPVIAISQLSRATEQRGGEKRPQLSDLRESGSIEQDADVVLFVYRQEFYQETPENKGLAEIIIGKQRNGPIGQVNLAFLKEYTRFENLSKTEFRSLDG